MSKEQRIKFSPNGAYIPSWSEVRMRFRININGDDYSEIEMSLLQDFCRAQRRLVEGEPEEGRSILNDLDAQDDFPEFERRYGSLLTDICKYVR